jgi:spore maturation protein CgeB
MRLAFVDTLYQRFVADHHRERPQLDRAGYAQQHASLIARSFGTSDAYSSEFRALGHEAVDLLVNAERLQRSWARENGVRVGPPLPEALPHRLRARITAPLLRRIARRQITTFAADVVYCQDLGFFTRDDLDELRAEGRLVVGQIASAAPSDHQLQGFDFLLTSFPHFVPRFHALGIDAEYFAIGFDDRVLGRLADVGIDASADAPGREAAVFMGGIDPAVHGGGVQLLERLLESVPLEVHGYGGDRLPSGSRLRRAWRGEAWGLDMYAVLARAGIVVNRHIASAEGNANNMRLFEATGTGALLLTEDAPNLPQLFAPGREVVAYHDAADLLEHLRHFLAHPDERRLIAAAGQRRTLADHTYRRRIAQLEGMLHARLS